MQKQRKSYSSEFKKSAVELSIELGNLKLAARELSINSENIRRWKKEPEKPNSKNLEAIINRGFEFRLLRKELTEVKLERDILQKASTYLFSGKQAKFEFIKQHLNYFPVRSMSRILGVSRSGFYKWVNRPPSKELIIIKIFSNR